MGYSADVAHREQCINFDIQNWKELNLNSAIKNWFYAWVEHNKISAFSAVLKCQESIFILLEYCNIIYFC